jgi:ATP-dependent RNA helicase DeaD
MPQIMKQLEYLSKEELLKRFVSLEFNRFLSYYKNTEDLNLPERSERPERGERADRGERGSKTGGKVRLKMNLGDREGLDPKRFLGIINDVTGDKSISIGSIEITNKYTFFDVFADQLDKVVSAFADQNEIVVTEAKGSKSFDDRKSDYRPRIGGSAGGSSRGGSGGGYRGGDRTPDRSSNRPAASAGGSEKPWRNRELGDRSSRPSGGSERRSSGGTGSGYKKRY